MSESYRTNVNRKEHQSTNNLIAHDSTVKRTDVRHLSTCPTRRGWSQTLASEVRLPTLRRKPDSQSSHLHPPSLTRPRSRCPEVPQKTRGRSRTWLVIAQLTTRPQLPQRRLLLSAREQLRRALAAETWVVASWEQTEHSKKTLPARSPKTARSTKSATLLIKTE